MSLALTNVSPIAEHCDGAPSLAVLNGKIYLAWKGQGNLLINISVSDDGGLSFRRKYTSTNQFTVAAPSLTTLNDTLYIAWTGTDHPQHLNVAQVTLGSDNNGEQRVVNIATPYVTKQNSDAAPALAAFNGDLYLAWKGFGTNNIYIASSTSNYVNDVQQKDNYADQPLALAVLDNSLYIGWKGTSPTPYLNYALVDVATLTIDTTSVFEMVTYNQIKQQTSGGIALASTNSTGAGTLITAFMSTDGFGTWLSISGTGETFGWLEPNYTGYPIANAAALTSFDGRVVVAWPLAGNGDLGKQQLIYVGRLNLANPQG